MALCVSCTWHMSDEQALTVEISCDNDPHPDHADELARRAAWLLRETIAVLPEPQCRCASI